MPSKLFELQSIFVLLIFLCTSVLSDGGIELRPYPTEPTSKDDIVTWVGERAAQLDRASLIKEAKETWVRLKNTRKPKDNKWDMPSVVSALTADGHTYFASSAKGTGDILNHHGMDIPDIVKEALHSCGKGHVNGARCGEIMVVALWHRENLKKLSEVPSKMIVAVNKNGIVDPCSYNPNNERHMGKDYGCKNFLKKMGFKEDEIITEKEESIHKPDSDCEVAKRSITGKVHNNKACATKPRAKSATPGKQAPKKTTAAPRKQPRKKVTTVPRQQPLKKATATPRKQLPKKATVTPRRQAPKKARKHKRSRWHELVELKGYSST